MSRKLEISPSEFVLSAIFFLQQKDGVTAKEITKYICKKWGCKQSSVANEVKDALDKAIENEIFVKKQGLYRVASGLGGNLKAIKKRMRKNKADNDAEISDMESSEQLQDSCKCPENVDDPWLNSPSSHSDRISLEQIDMLKNKADGDDDDDDEEDFLEDEDDELDFFADDQVPQSYDLKKECHTTAKAKPSCGSKGKRSARSKHAPSKQKRRKVSKPRKRTNKRRKLVCTCKNSDSGSATVKSCRSCDAEDEDDLDAALEDVTKDDKCRPDECDNRSEGNKRRNTGKKGKGGGGGGGGGGAGAAQESDDDSCNCAPTEEGKDNQTEETKDTNGTSKDDQAKKNALPAEQPKRKGKEAKKSEEKEIEKTGGDGGQKKKAKDRAAPSPVKATATPTDLPPEKEWRRKKTKRERSSSLFRPIKKQFSSKDKPNAEQKSGKNKTSK